MKTIARLMGAVLVAGFYGNAHAQANRTFVSGLGNDSNPCSLTAPCRTFQHAHDQTNAGGDITVLDPAGYGPVVITKSISIINDGVGEAAITITTSGTPAITIDGGPYSVINLRGLTLIGSGSFGSGQTGDGLLVNGALALTVQNCVIRDFSGNGVKAVTQPPVTLAFSDTVVSHNGASGFALAPFGTNVVTAVFQRVQAIQNFTGFSISGYVQALAADSVAAGNATTGITASSLSSQYVATFTLDNSKVMGSDTGITASSNGTIFLRHSTIMGNYRGFNVQGGTINSFGDNAIVATTNTGSLTSISQQ